MSAREETRAMIAKLAEQYPSPDWFVLSEVRNVVGSSDEIRYADALAVRMLPASAPWACVRFECKRTRADWLNELEQPEKRAAHEPYVTASYLVVPAPRKKVIPFLGELPAGWGLLEIGNGGDRVVEIQAAEHREVEPPPLSFVRALLHAASARPVKAESGSGEAPMRAVAHHKNGVVELVCGHSFRWDAKPKDTPRKFECWACAELAQKGAA